MSQFKVNLCKRMMRFAEAKPNMHDPHMWEVFKTEHYLKGSEFYKADIRNKSSQASYDYEQDKNDSWLVKYFFPRLSPNDLKDTILLDLGSFTGGRLTAWTEQYKLKTGLGIDINPIFQTAGEEFARSKGLNNIKFFTGVGEFLPFDNNSIDFIVSTDVFEHVENLAKVLDECYRVLKPGGMLCVVFPQFLQPLESHLGCVTKFPALHWIFSCDTITKAYVEIISERKDSNWYYPESYPLQYWERLPSLNGTSYKDFVYLLSKHSWASISEVIRPILTDGRRSKGLLFVILRLFIFPLAHFKKSRELFLGRINFIVKK